MATIFVKKGAGGAEDGTSWEDAYDEPNDASPSGSDELWICEGTYTDTPVIGVANCIFYGGFANTLTGVQGSVEGRDWENDITIFDASDSGRVVTFVSDASFDGITITQGAGAPGGASDPDNFDDVTIDNCTFSESNSTSYGGCMRIQNGSGWDFDNCTFSNNATSGATHNGGALYLVAQTTTTFTDCTFDGNDTTGAYSSGAHISAASGSGVTISGCEFKNATNTNNNAVDVTINSTVAADIDDSTFHNGDTEGLGLLGSGSHTVDNCEIYSNSKRGVNLQGPATFTNCKIYSNGGSNFINGAGVYCYGASAAGTFKNCVIYSNTCTNNGGGTHVHTSGGSITLTNCTVADNTSNYGACGCNVNAGSATITNCIFWGNSGTDITAGQTVTYSNVEGGYTGTGNINSNPSFVGSGDDYYDIQSGSPCIDAGNGNVAPSTDILGRSRVDDTGVSDTGTGTPTYTDIGAYEYPFSAGGGDPENAIFFGCNF